MKTNYIIYKAENLKNNKLYIGCTTCSIGERKKNHEYDSLNMNKAKFHKAISTYGAEAFKWEQIDTAKSIDELAKKEKNYIIKYNSKENGYNSDEGGGVKKTVYQYDFEGNHIESFDCLEDAGNIVGAKKQQISKACLSKKTSKGFYWSYDYVEKFIPNVDSRKKCVYQYTLEGEFVNEFNSISDASRQTGCNKSSIAKVCRFERKSSGGYIWNFK